MGRVIYKSLAVVRRSGWLRLCSYSCALLVGAAAALAEAPEEFCVAVDGGSLFDGHWTRTTGDHARGHDFQSDTCSGCYGELSEGSSCEEGLAQNLTLHDGSLESYFQWGCVGELTAGDGVVPCATPTPTPSEGMTEATGLELLDVSHQSLDQLRRQFQLWAMVMGLVFVLVLAGFVRL